MLSFWDIKVWYEQSSEWEQKQCRKVSNFFVKYGIYNVYFKKWNKRCISDLIDISKKKTNALLPRLQP